MLNNSITEITALFNDPDSLKADMSEGLGLMREHINRKYVNKIGKIIKACEDSIDANPSKEVMLLEALKPFAPSALSEKIEGFIGMHKQMHILNEIQNRLSTPDNTPFGLSAASSEKSKISSVHEDGVYDIDENCVLNKMPAKGGAAPTAAYSRQDGEPLPIQEQPGLPAANMAMMLMAMMNM
jgi:hypothetical protein